MSNPSATELGRALRQALPSGYEPLGIVVDRGARQWHLSLGGAAILSAAELQDCSARLSSLAGEFTIVVHQDPPVAIQDVAEQTPAFTEDEGWSDEPPWEEDTPENIASQPVPTAKDDAKPAATQQVRDAVQPISPDKLSKAAEEAAEVKAAVETIAEANPEDYPTDGKVDLAVDEQVRENALTTAEIEALDPADALVRELESQEEEYRREREEREQTRLAEMCRTVPVTLADEPYYGRPVRSKPTPLVEIVDASGKVTVCGQVIVCDTFVSRNTGSTTYRFDICDKTDSITVKVLPGFGRGRDRETPKTNRLAEIKKGQWIIVQGSLSEDPRDQELHILADNIDTYDAPPLREDTAEAHRKRVELHAHTNMSSMDALPSADSLVRLAARFGHPAVAITDHGVLQSYPEAMQAAKACGIKVIYGCEIYLIDSTEDRGYYHLTVLVKNKEGLKALYELVSEAHLNYFYRRPRILRELLRSHREHLLLGSACAAGEVYRALYTGYNTDFAAAVAKATELAAFYDYLEVMPLGHMDFLLDGDDALPGREALIEINKAMLDIGKQLGKPVVATSDVHFLNPEDAIYREILQAGQDYDQDDSQCLLHLRTTEEMLEEFSYLAPELAEQIVIDNTQAIAAQIDVIQPIPNKLYPPSLEGADTMLRQLAEETARARYGDPLPQIVHDRLERELQCIIGYGYAVTYYIAHKLVKRSIDDGYLVGSRGSVGSSLAATFAGITEVNPLPAHYLCPQCRYSDFSLGEEYDCGADLPDKQCPECGAVLQKEGFNIAFETFMGFEGDKVPDIDLNFSGEYHAEAHRQCEELLGKENVFRAGTISTIADKTAYGFALKYLEKIGQTKRKAEIGRLAQGLIGIKRTTGQHPGGLMVVPADMDLHDFTPAQHPADDKGSDIITTHFDFHAIHDCLLKLDLLGHDDPTILRHLQDLTGIDVRTVPLSDPKVLSLFVSTEALGDPNDFTSKIGTLGVPEFGTGFVRGMLQDAQPKLFSDLVRISGFSHGTDVWLGNARDIIVGGTAPLKEAISTRDDIMAYLISKGLPSKVAFKIMEAVRKGRGLTADDEQQMRACEVPEWYITSCKKIQYLFPKAHAVAYVTSGVRIAWFKVYRPEAFYATYFGIRGSDGFDAGLAAQGSKALNAALQELQSKIKANSATPKEQSQLSHLEVACEASARGIQFLPVDLYRSHATKYQIMTGGLLSPLSGLPGVGANAAQSIVDARAGGEFTSIEDLRLRAKVNKSVIEVLQNAGCLEGMTETDQLTLF